MPSTAGLLVRRVGQVSARLSAWPRRWVVLPAVLATWVVAMTALGISGSSVALNWPNDDGPVVGEVRPIRSDEWWVRTPMVVHQSVNEFPNESRIGMGEHDQGVLSDLPTSHVTMVLRPHLWAYRVMPLEQAFAFEWWGVLGLAALGPYALLWLLTRRAAMAAALGLAVMASPVLQWWTGPTAGSSIGYLCLGVAALVAATRASGIARPWMAVLSGWLFACAVAVLYLAWLLPLGLALAPLAVAAIREGRTLRVTWRADRMVLVVAAAVTAVGALTFVMVHREAVAALRGTVYPGARSERGGTGDLVRLLGAPYYWFVARHPAEPIGVLGTNESEASGPLFLVLPAAVAYLGAMLSMGRCRARSLATAAIVGATGLLVWFVVPVPASVGALVGLDQVPPNRLLHAFAPVGALCLGLVVHAMAELDARRRRRLGAAGGVVVFLATLWAGMHFALAGTTVSPSGVLVVSSVFAAACGLAIGGAVRLGTAALAMVVLAAAVFTNPLQRGLGPLRSTPLVAAIQDVDDEYPGVWASTVDDWNVIATLVASGVDSISGASMYPDDETWLLIDPDESEADAWNRYSHIIVVARPSGFVTTVTLISGDTLVLDLDLCGDDAQALSIGKAIISADGELPACGSVVDATEGPSGPVYLVALAPG